MAALAKRLTRQKRNQQTVLIGLLFIVECNSIVINNFSSGSNNDLTLDITIPNEEFEKISVEIKNANIDVASYIKARFITVENKNGNVDVSIGNIGTSHVSVDSKNGSCKNNTRLKGTLLSGSLVPFFYIILKLYIYYLFLYLSKLNKLNLFPFHFPLIIYIIYI